MNKNFNRVRTVLRRRDVQLLFAAAAGAGLMYYRYDNFDRETLILTSAQANFMELEPRASIMYPTKFGRFFLVADHFTDKD